MTKSLDFTWDATSKTTDFVINHTIFDGAVERIQRCYESYGKTSIPHCLAILGASRTGKTTVIDEFIRNLGNRRNEVVVVKLKVAKNTKALVSQILLALGDPIFEYGTEMQMTARIIYLFGQQKRKLMIIDDFQNLIDRQKKQRLHFLSAEIIKAIISDDEVKIPLVLCGLPSARALFERNEQVKGRFRSIYLLKRFNWDVAETKALLKNFLATLQTHVKFDPKLQLESEDMAFRYYCATNGLVGLIMQIAIEAKYIADELGTGIVTIDDLAKAYDEAVCRNIDVPLINPFTEKDHEKLKQALLAIMPADDRLENLI